MGESAPLAIGFEAGITPTKWFSRWNERRSDRPLAPTPLSDGSAVEALASGLVEVAFVRRPPEPRDVVANGLHLVPLYVEAVAVVVAADADLAVLDAATFDDLSGIAVMRCPGVLPVWDEFDDSGGRHVLDVSLTSIADAVGIVAGGDSAVVLPQPLARQLSRRDVAILPLAGIAPTRVALAWRRDLPTEPRSDAANADIQEFLGIVRGRTANSSRGAPGISGQARAATPRSDETRETGPASGRTAGSGKRKGTGGRGRVAPARGRRRPL